MSMDARRRVGFVGLGRLGYPVAVCLAQKFDVVGYDVNPARMAKDPLQLTGEQGDWFGFSAADLLTRASLRFSPLSELSDCEVIFLAVQTPHRPELEGATVINCPPEDFNYSHLVKAVSDLMLHVKPEQTLVIISTCLPGTIRREVLPLIDGRCKLCYNPFFIAMGTVIKDFLKPEFVLLGGDSDAVARVEDLYREFYFDLHFSRPPVLSMSIESAELTKVSYNIILSQKVATANALGELCHKIPGCDVDVVTGALKQATDRVVSAKYMDAGGGDGGGCHPRDNIAMSWLADKIGLSYDPCGAVTKAREAQAGWMIDLIIKHAGQRAIVLVGKAYKPNVSLTAGSWALLLADIMRSRGIKFSHYDPHVDGPGWPGIGGPALFFIATKHDCFKDYEFPAGSTVIDPFRYLPERDGVKLVKVGVGL